MLAVSRRTAIKELIKETKSLKVSDLTEKFSVTEETIRRDFKALEKEGVLTKTYGGAFIREGIQNEIDINIRQTIAVEGKKIIAAKAAELIHDGDIVFLDASTTSLFIAQKIQSMRITVITNSLLVSNAISQSESAQLILLGGIYVPNSKSFLGRSAIAAMQHYFVDKTFISCRSISMTHGITDSNEQQAEIRELAVERSNFVCLVSDYTKFNKTSFTTVCAFDRLDTLIVDQELDEEWHEFLKERNVELLSCENIS